MTTTHHDEEDDGELTEEQIEYIRSIAGSKNIPDKNFVYLFDELRKDYKND